MSGETRVYLPDEGTYRPIRELEGKSGFRVLAVNRETWRLEPREATHAFATGRKPVFKLRTRLGREIRATANHKFLAFDGWRRLDDLAQGIRLAVPKTLTGPEQQTMSDSELALLGHLIGDGCTLPRHAIQYTTKDRELAGLVATLAEDVFGDALMPRINAERTWYQVYLAAGGRLTHGVRNPVASWLDELGAFGLRSWAAIETRYCGSTLYKSNLGRGRARRVAEAVGTKELRRLATSDVYWDEILSIEPDGEEDVFDLTVCDLHNFVAADCIVHNSIEQDADVVAFIYRDEYYNDESDQQGLAEVIVAKHRNGPTDAIKLSFLKRYAKFADLAA